MTELVQKNLSKAQQQQKRWYDSNARSIQETGLLPSLTNKLWVQWEGPCEIKRRIGKVDCEVDMFDKKKKKRKRVMLTC